MFRRRFKRRRRSYSRKYRGRRSGRGKLWKRVKKLSKAISAEIRWAGNIRAYANVTNAWVFDPINLMTIGDLNGNREASRIYMKNFTLKGLLVSGASSGDVIRMCLVYDTQTNGAIFATSDVFQTDNNVTSLRNWYSKGRYKLLVDKTYNVSSQQPTKIRWFKKLNKFTNYNAGNAGTVADIYKGSLYLIIMANFNTQTACAYHTRMTYSP